jgi:hypothetical protein
MLWRFAVEITRIDPTHALCAALVPFAFGRYTCT